ISFANWPARLLGPFVRDGGLPLERAVQHATSLTAAQFGILDRGILMSGRPADIVVFDPETISDGPVSEVGDLPLGATRLLSEPIGIEYVIVNGAILREHNKDAVAPDGPLPGRLLRDFQHGPRPEALPPIPAWIREQVETDRAAHLKQVTEISEGNPPRDPAQPERILA